MVELKQGSALKGGKYKIVKVLGQGSFGITYLATTRISIDGQLGKMDVTVNVTIKEFFMSDLNSRAADGTNVEKTSSTLVKNYQAKFRKEAENLAKLNHPNIVKVLEVFGENNTTYYVMEYVDGGTVNDYIKAKGHLPENEALQIAQKVCGALSYMHKHKMLHLDLKPKNIMRNAEGQIFLIDFGLAKQYTEDGEPESSTSIGLGTPGYAPIEQAHYKKDGSLPVTLDIYALGATLFKMLTGKTPPESSYVLNEGLPLQQLKETSVSDAVIAIVEKAMAPMKKERYQSVEALSSAISNDDTIIQEEKDEGTSYDDQTEEVTNFSSPNNDVSWEEESHDEYEEDGDSSFLEKYWKYGAISIIIIFLVYCFYSNKDPLSVSPADSISIDDVYDSLYYDSIRHYEVLDSMEALTPKSRETIHSNEMRTRTDSKQEQASSRIEQRQIADANIIKTGTTNEVALSVNKAESSQSQLEKSDKVYDVVEGMPSFPGGDAELMRYFSQNMKYPAEAEMNGIQGKVLVTFIVERDGTITNIQVVKSVDPSLDKEAVRVVRNMPKWRPGMDKGAAVRVKYTIPVTFRLA